MRLLVPDSRALCHAMVRLCGTLRERPPHPEKPYKRGVCEAKGVFLAEMRECGFSLPHKPFVRAATPLRARLSAQDRQDRLDHPQPRRQCSCYD